MSFNRAILLGAAGWGLIAFTRVFLLYSQLLYGEVARVAYSYLLNGTVDEHTVSVGLSLLPVGPLFFLALLYLEAVGELAISIRRIGSGFAAGLMFLATAWSLTPMFGSVFPRTGSLASPGSLYHQHWAAWVVTAAFLLGWVLFMLVFCVRRAPLSDRITTVAAASIGLWSTAVLCVTVVSLAIRTGLQLKYPVATGIEIAAPVLMLIFAISVFRAASVARQNAG